MEIRVAGLEDMEILEKYDLHVQRKALKNIILQSRIYIASKNGIFVGWLRYNLFWDNTPFMNMLYILDAYRNKGYGKRLVEYWETEMKQRNYKTVMTSTASNEYAQHFYHKLGYLTVGGFLPEDEPFEVILSKRLCFFNKTTCENH